MSNKVIGVVEEVNKDLCYVAPGADNSVVSTGSIERPVIELHAYPNIKSIENLRISKQIIYTVSGDINGKHFGDSISLPNAKEATHSFLSSANSALNDKIIGRLYGPVPTPRPNNTTLRYVTTPMVAGIDYSTGTATMRSTRTSEIGVYGSQSGSSNQTAGTPITAGSMVSSSEFSLPAGVTLTDRMPDGYDMTPMTGSTEAPTSPEPPATTNSNNVTSNTVQFFGYD